MSPGSSLVGVLASLATLLGAPSRTWGRGPRPGDVYREFTVTMTGSRAWRVTDPQSKVEGARAFLPNPVLEMEVFDLQDARRAELLIDRWGGHRGTKGKKLRFNEQAWIDLPELATVPPGADPSCYMYEDNPVVEVPLTHLRTGLNRLEGTSGDQQSADCKGFGWGQWGWYGAVLRVYYTSKKPHPAARIVSPRVHGTIGDYPSIEVVASGKGNAITRVDVLASYDGYDDNGDGVFADWHGAYHYAELQSHVGTATAAPFRLVWDTRWVPDQAPQSVKLIARVRDADGVWSVTPIVAGLTLRRAGTSVKLYRPLDVPSGFWVRAGREASSRVHVPADDNLGRAVEAAVHLRTWNGVDERFTLGDYVGDIAGANHNYVYGIRDIPTAALMTGDMRVRFHSDSQHHGPEILWPGPGVTVRYGAAPRRPDWLDEDQPYRLPLSVRSGGVARPEMPVEVELDLGDEIDRASLRLTELDSPGARPLPRPWQWTPAPGGEKTGHGTLTLMSPPMSEGQTRMFAFSFSPEGSRYQPAAVAPLVAVKDSVAFQGQDSFEITTPTATYVYHKEGGGFAGLRDRDGREWIGYKPGGRAAGEFRGLPNLGDVGHPGYAGEKGVTSRLEARGPIKVTIASESPDRRWSWKWDIFPATARLTISRAGGPYWFLYEGTPGGTLELDRDFTVRSNGERRPVSEPWYGDLAGPEWVYFGDQALDRALFLVKHADDEMMDQFYQMDGQMTVFGFGRKYPCCDKYLAGPATFTIGLVEPTHFPRARAAIEAAYRPLVVEVGPLAHAKKRAPVWQHLSSANGDLPVPGESPEQTGAVVADLDRDGVEDFVIGFRAKAPALAWYRRTGNGWKRYVVESELLTLDAGGTTYDIDGDGDLDIVFGNDGQGNALWWWENPSPSFDASVSWKRRFIKDGGSNGHHDQLFADLLGTGRPQLVFWNQKAKTLFLAEVPDDPRHAGPWRLLPIFTGNAGEGKRQAAAYAEGLDAADIDGDGKIDLLAGNMWLKHLGGHTFKPIVVGEIGGRIAAGQLKTGGRPEIVIAPGDGSGPLRWYECTGDPQDATAWKSHDLLERDMVHGHSLALGDVDGDGHLDVVAAEMAKWLKTPEPDHPGATAWILYGDGRGAFHTTELVRGHGFHELKLGDLDGDGDLDILNKPYAWRAPRVDIWLNNGTGPRRRSK